MQSNTNGSVTLRAFDSADAIPRLTAPMGVILALAVLFYLLQLHSRE